MASSAVTLNDVQEGREGTGVAVMDWKEKPSRLSLSSSSGTEGYHDANEHHQFPEMSTARAVGLVAVCTTAITISIASNQGMAIALPSIGAALGIPNSRLQWLVSSNSLTTGCFLLLFGRLSDLYGHRRVFLLGMSWTTVWNLGCGFAPNEIGMDIMRGLAGLGTAASIPAAVGVLGNSFPPGPTKSYAFATFSAGAPTGASLGLVLGGVITQYTAPGWKAFFYVLAGLSALVTINGFLFVPSLPITATNRSVDWIGAFLITLSLFGITITVASLSAWSASYIAGFLVGSVVLLLLFLEWEWYLESGELFGFKRWYKGYGSDGGRFRDGGRNEPLMKISLWGKGKFAMVQLIGFIGWSAFNAYPFFMTIFFQDYQRLNAALTTARFVPMTISGVLINIVVAFLFARLDANLILVGGTILMSIAPLLAAVQDVSLPYWAFQFPGIVLIVFGADTIFPCSTMYCSKIAAPDEQAMAGGIFNTVTQLGTGIGLGIVTEVYNKVTAHEALKIGIVVNSDQSNIPPESLLKGIRAAFWTATGIGFLCSLLALLTLRNVGRVGAKKTIRRREKVPKMEEMEREREGGEGGEEKQGRVKTGEDGVM